MQRLQNNGRLENLICRCLATRWRPLAARWRRVATLGKPDQAMSLGGTRILEGQSQLYKKKRNFFLALRRVVKSFQECKKTIPDKILHRYDDPKILSTFNFSSKKNILKTQNIFLGILNEILLELKQDFIEDFIENPLEIH